MDSIKKIEIFLIITCYLTFGISFAFLQGCENRSNIEDYKSGIFHVGELIIKNGKQDTKWLGSAFLVDDKCTFVTAKHIFKESNKDKIIIRFILLEDKTLARTMPIKILYEDPNSDLAFLKIEFVNNQPCQSKKSYSFNLPDKYSKGLFAGEPVYIIGHPILEKTGNIDSPVVRKGIISSSDLSWGGKPMILLDLIGVPGFSGSPVIFEKTGEAMGVIFGPGPTKRGFGFEWATPITMEKYLIALSENNSDDTSNGN